MKKWETVTSDMFDPEYNVTARLIKHSDTVHRKNKNFAYDGLSSSKFSNIICRILAVSNRQICDQIVGSAILPKNSEKCFAQAFLNTNCRYYVSYHDDVRCTVEFTCKFDAQLKDIVRLGEELVSHLHLEIHTPLGSVQV